MCEVCLMRGRTRANSYIAKIPSNKDLKIFIRDRTIEMIDVDSIRASMFVELLCSNCSFLIFYQYGMLNLNQISRQELKLPFFSFVNEHHIFLP